MKKMIALTIIMASQAVLAAPRIPKEHRFGEMVVTEITSSSFEKMMLDQAAPTTTPTPTPAPAPSLPAVDPLERAGKVVAAAKDMVALGEVIYTLVQKGKPKNQTEYAPISVVPKDPTTKEIMDPFELEGFSLPVEKVFNVKLKNMTGKTVVDFTYKLIYSYNGSYNGAGKYLTGVQIVPASIRTSFGWDFNATMKVAGMMNHGTKQNPIAGVMIAIKYQMNSWGQAHERNDTIHIAGNGAVKSYGIK